LNCQKERSMSDISQAANIRYYPRSGAPETAGYRLLKWGALTLFIIETISVGDGIIQAIIMMIKH
jgi:hypothetical protein